MTDQQLAARQAAAAAAGRRAEAEGQAVIYIHGRPYADPDANPQERTESPFPWGQWDQTPNPDEPETP